MKIGYRIKEVRKAKNLTQREVAERLGISQTAFQKFEQDASSPKIDTIEKIAGALGVTVHELIPEEKTSKSKDHVQLLKLEEHFNSLNDTGRETALDIVGILGRVDDLKK